jgi:hypothetical protein
MCFAIKLSRARLVDHSVTRCYHCITRCMPRALLMSDGLVDHKHWLENRL